MPRRRGDKRARTVLVWLAATFVVVQLGLVIFLDFWRPEAFSAEYEAHTRLLRARLKEEPDRPLLLMLGSSRMTLGYRPEVLPSLIPTSGPAPLPFNFAHFGSGPTMNLQLLLRLLHQGIHPRWLVVEIMPPKINHDSTCWPLTACVLSELPMLCRYFQAWKVLSVYGRIRLSPWNAVRPYLQAHVTPALGKSPAGWAQDQYCLDPLGGDSHWQAVKHLEPDQVRQRSEFMRLGYAPEMRDFSIKAGPDRAILDLLNLCRREKIAVVFLLSPESRQFQSYYPPDGLVELQRYCQHLRQDCGATVVDARDWLGPEEFMDGHHPLLHGADAFTRRLGREVLQPLVTGGEEAVARMQAERNARSVTLAPPHPQTLSPGGEGNK